MSKLLSSLSSTLSRAKGKVADYVFKERTLEISEDTVNRLIEADESFSNKLSEKGLSRVRFQVEQDRITLSGILKKHVKGAAFKVELTPEKILWTKDEQTIFMKMLDYELKMEQGGYFDIVKLAMVKMIMALFSQEKILKFINIEVEDKLIKIDMKDAGQNTRKIMQSIELREIRCLAGRLAVTIKPRPDMTRENISLIRDWLLEREGK